MINSNLPIINSLDNATADQVQALMKYGFCYIKIDEAVEPLLESSSKTARIYFDNQSEEQKKQYAYNPQTCEGYVNYKENRSVNIQHYAYRGGDLPNPFSQEQAKMDNIKHQLDTKLALPLVKQIFTQSGIEDDFNYLSKHYSPTLAYSYYLHSSLGIESRLPAHTDAILITVLFACEPGLEVYHDNEWHELAPEPGYVVIMLGKSLELMTGGECKAALHRVHPHANKDRLTVAVYLKLNLDLPVIDYKNGKQLFANSEELFKAQEKIIYNA